MRHLKLGVVSISSTYIIFVDVTGADPLVLELVRGGHDVPKDILVGLVVGPVRCHCVDITNALVVSILGDLVGVPRGIDRGEHFFFFFMQITMRGPIGELLDFGPPVLEPHLDLPHGHVQLHAQALPRQGVGLRGLREHVLEHLLLLLRRSLALLHRERVVVVDVLEVSALRLLENLENILVVVLHNFCDIQDFFFLNIA